MKTGKRMNRVISRRTPALSSSPMTVCSSGATGYVIAVAAPMRRSNVKRRLVSRQDSKAQQRIDLPIQKLERLEADFPLGPSHLPDRRQSIHNQSHSAKFP